MAIQFFDNLGDVGVIEDTPDYELPHNAWTDGENVRFVDGIVEKFTGHQAVFDPPSAAPYFATPLQVGSDYFWFYAGLNDIYATDGSSHGNVSPTGQTGSASATADINWNGGALGGGILVLNNGVRAPYQWNGSAITDPLTALSNWPASMVARVVRPFKQVLVAADIDEGSGRDGTLLRWSHPAAPGAVPSSWDYTDDTNDAGRTTITQGGDFILDMEPLRDINGIYKENSIWLMQFVGGRAQYAFRKAFDQIGSLSRRCAKEFFGKHIVLGNDDIIMHDGHRVEQFLHKRWRKWLFNNIDSDNYERAFLAMNYAQNEVWFCFPETGFTLPNIALVWNWKDNTTYVRALPVGTAHIERGIVNDGVSSAIEDQSGKADEVTGTFDEQTYSAAKRYLLMCDTNLTKFYQGDTSEQFNGTSFTAYVERTALPLARIDTSGRMKKSDLSRIKFVSEVWPVIEGTLGGEVNVYVGSRQYIGDTVSWDGPHVYTIGTSEKINVRVSGRFIDIRFESTGNINWKLMNYGVNWRLEGVR